MRPAVVCLLAALAACDPLATMPGLSPTSTASETAHFKTKLSKLELETFDTNACESGDRQQFLGADLKPAESEKGPVVRIVIDPLTGPAVRIFDPEHAGRTATYRKSDCKKFQVDVTETGEKVNEIRDYKVELDLDCEHGNGSMLAGAAKIEHCH